MLYVLPPPPPGPPGSPSIWSSIICWGCRNKLRLGTMTLYATDDAATLQDGHGQKTCNKSLNECYFAGKSAAVVLSALTSAQNSKPLRLGSSRTQTSSASASASAAAATTHQPGSDIQQHLQSMCYLLRPEDTLKMAVKLESGHVGRTRYLVVVSNAEQSCLLGIDCGVRSTVGLVLRVLADTTITLDGDGGFKVSVCNSQHIFKPVSVQAMWSALQTLHRVSAGAREKNFYSGGLSHGWVAHYEACIQSERSCLNEWHAMDALESRRPPSPDSLRNKPSERSEAERIIRYKLKEIMMSVDLDEVTSKHIRTRLEDDLDTDLGEYKPFIDQEMLVILGQMDAPTEVFENVYLGSEWNASNLEELQKNGIRYILNVTREIDNFFPGMFDYLNVRVYDDDKTDLLKHWDDTYKYIFRASRSGSKVLVHCKMGISRSASVVIAYAMKAFDWDLARSLKHVKNKRNCIKPNTNFVNQLETYQGILDAMKNREKLQRSKSETNLERKVLLIGAEPTPLVQALERHRNEQRSQAMASHILTSRPKSWSPDDLTKESDQIQSSLSLEEVRESKNIVIPCNNGKIYSVSQNRIVHLEGKDDAESSKVKSIVCELESQSKLTIEKDTWDPGPTLEEKSPWLTVKNNNDVSIMTLQRENNQYETKLDDITLHNAEEKKVEEKQSPSRQNSWSSFDSAVGGSIRNTPSRHSSWGSGDNRTSRNSSLGSYDVPWYTGNVKRTRFKLECGRDEGNHPLINLNIHCPKPYRNPFGSIHDTAKDCNRLSTSAPEVSSMPILREGVLLRSKSIPSTNQSYYEDAKLFGLVKNLKLEFEAKTANTSNGKQSDENDCRNKTKEEAEDLSVKLLVGKYENTKQDSIPNQILFESKQKANKMKTNSVCISGEKSIEQNYRRPPIVMKTNTNSLVANVVVKAASKKQLQHGKTHPLTRLTGSNKSRYSNNSTAYNTM